MKSIIILIALLINTSFGFDQLSDKEALRGEITKRLENVSKIFDKNARVDVSLKITKRRKKVNTKNPFLLSIDSNKKGQDYYISKVSAVVFTKYDENSLPNTLRERIKNILKQYSKNNEMSFSSFSEESVGYFSNVKPFELSLILLMSLSLCFGIFAFFRSQKGSVSHIGKIVEEGINKLSNSLEQLSTTPEVKTETTPFNIEVNSGKDSFLIDVSLESLEEVLMDCYWSHEDSYAAYLWDRLDILRKGQLIERNRRLSDYGAYLQSVEQNNKRHVSDSYYISPLPLASIDNESLTNLVEKYNSLFHLLPKLRIDKLDLSALKKKEFFLKKYSEEDTQFEIQNINWEEYRTTQTRAFESIQVFEFKDFDEEEEFFKENGHDVSLLKAFPSLSWLTLLREDDIDEILSSYTAKQLAIAWHAPQSVLEKLESCLPEEKLSLLKTYKDNLASNRSNSVYNQIMVQVAEKLDKRTSLAA